MLELLASIDPFAIPLFAILAYSALMMPLGILLPCGKCCGACTQCQEGALPDTITVALSNIDPARVIDWSVGALTTLRVDTEADVTKATGIATLPLCERGPIEAVELTNAGSGYAWTARIPPLAGTVSLVPSPARSGTAAVTPTFSMVMTAGKKTWQLSGGTIVNAGSGYYTGDRLYLYHNGGNTGDWLDITASDSRAAPAVACSVTRRPYGWVELSYTLSAVAGGYTVSAVSIVDGGSDNVVGDPIEAYVDTGTTQVTPVQMAVSAVDQDGKATAISITSGGLFTAAGGATPHFWLNNEAQPTTGSGAAMTATLSGGPTTWSVTAVSIASGGTGYNVNDRIIVSIAPINGYYNGTVDTAARVVVSSVDANGSITGIQIEHGGQYWGRIGNITGVAVGRANSRLYSEDPTLPADVATTSVFVQTAYTRASGSTPANITATIDSNAGSPTFGRVTGFTIVNGGTDYIAYNCVAVAQCLSEFWNGKTVVLRKSPTNPCLFLKSICPYGNGYTGTISVTYYGPGIPPMVEVGTMGYMRLRSTTLVSNCNAFAFVATDHSGITAAVNSGGTYVAEAGEDGTTPCIGGCCRGTGGEEPDEVTVSVTAGSATFTGPMSNGDYVARHVGAFWWRYVALGSPNMTVNVYLTECAASCNDCTRTKCETIVEVYAVSDSTTLEGSHSSTCLHCGSVPKCSPDAGDYAVKKAYPGNAEDVGSTAWTITIN